MQTTGACLFASSRCSSPRVQTPAQDSRSAHGLLYPAAVRDDQRQHEHCQGGVDISPASLTAPEAVDRLAHHLGRPLGERPVGPCLVLVGSADPLDANYRRRAEPARTALHLDPWPSPGGTAETVMESARKLLLCPLSPLQEPFARLGCGRRRVAGPWRAVDWFRP